MTWLIQTYENIQAFIESGGNVLQVIGAVTLLMWILIIERFFFYWFVYPEEAKDSVNVWAQRGDKKSWYAQKIRDQMISKNSQKIHQSLSMIKTLIAVCPLLGLLGTVTGMIELFDIMAMMGSANTRAMASGVSMATIPTMAGMVAALSGIYFSARLEKTAKDKTSKFKDLLKLEEA